MSAQDPGLDIADELRRLVASAALHGDDLKLLLAESNRVLKEANAEHLAIMQRAIGELRVIGASLEKNRKVN